jgi:hypothetical protein
MTPKEAILAVLPPGMTADDIASAAGLAYGPTMAAIQWLNAGEKGFGQVAHPSHFFC